MRISAALFAATSLTLAAAAAQEKANADSAVYKVEFNIHDGNDATARTGRRYAILIGANEKGVFRVGQKMPYVTGSVPNNQYTYVDVGVNIDCHLNEVNGKIGLRASLDLSSVIPQDKNASSSIPSPAIGQMRIDVNAVVNPGKPTIVASIDDPVTLRKVEVDATVTKVN